MVDLTVGYVAGIIAAAVTLVRLWTPNTLVYIISGVLGDKNTAVTWSVAGRALQNSLWPDFLKTDTALTRGVRWDVRILVKSIQIMKLLIALAGIITPLGLYSTIGTGKSVITRFEYVRDSSPFGISTPPRSDGKFGRTCNRGIGVMSGPAPCPYTNDVVLQNETHYIMPYNLTYDVPDILMEIYGSGTRGWPNTIANYFDIEWRQWTKSVGNIYNNGSEFLVGSYRQMGSLILRDEIVPVEGLLVDMIDGGVGFRNHTLPTGVELGGSWSEDILFIQPESACVDTNLTLAFEVKLTNSSERWSSPWGNLRLIDRGGFSKMNQTYPYYDHVNAQTNPDLRERAYKAAWLNNAMSAVYFNVTNPTNQTSGLKAWQYVNSEVGKEFPLRDSKSSTLFESLSLGDNYGSYLDANMETSTTLGNSNYSNPFRISAGNFSDTKMICQGAGKQDIANISNIIVQCGMMYGAANRADGGSSILFEAGSKWTVPLYSCATTIKATIKTVDFLLNGTSGLASLHIEGLRPKTYTNDSLPLWAMEDTGRTLEEFIPIWGLLHPAYSQYPNMSVVRKESLYLPGYAYNSLSKVQYQNLPGTDFYRAALNSVYDDTAKDSLAPAADYTGYSNTPLHVKWQQLGRDPATAGKIPNLIWTDLAAAAVVGTKSALGGRRDNVGPVQIVVRPLQSQIQYRWLFGIPALLVLLLCLGIATFALITFVFHRHNLEKLRRHLQQTTAGRIFTSFIYPEYSSLTTPTPLWNQSVGSNVIDLGEENALMTAMVKNNFYKGTGRPVGVGEPGRGGLPSPLEKGLTSHERELNEANERLVPDRVPSPYQGAGGIHEHNYLPTGSSIPHQNGYRG